MTQKSYSSKGDSNSPLYLKLTDKLEPLYQKLGIDYAQMRTILKMKMTVDSRKEAVIQGAGSNQNAREGEGKNPFFTSLWIYTLLSCFLLVLFAYDNWVFQYTTYFSFIFIMIFSTTIANFSTILLDIKDSVLIGSKPVSSKTIGAAKATHIALYLIAFTLAIGLPVILFTFYKNGVLAGILVFLLTFLAAFWCLGLTIVMYATVLRRFDGERLKNIIAYSQILLSIVMVLGYYAMGQLFDIIDPETLLVEINLQLEHVLLFPMWFVAPFGLLQDGFTLTYGIYGLLLLLGTLSIGALYYFNNDKIDRHLQKMETSTEKKKTRSLIERVAAKLFCLDSIEKAYFHFTWQLTKEEREFKTRLYPSFVSALVFPAVMLFSDTSTPLADRDPLVFMLLPYFAVLIIPMLAVSVQFSANYKGKWIFSLSPKTAKEPFIRAVTKVMIIKITLPMYLVVSSIFIYASGTDYLLHLLNGFLLVTTLLYVENWRINKSLPFTQKYAASEANQGCMATLIFFVPVLLLALALIYLQSLSYYVSIGIFICLVLVNIWWMRRGFKG